VLDVFLNFKVVGEEMNELVVDIVMDTILFSVYSCVKSGEIRFITKTEILFSRCALRVIFERINSPLYTTLYTSQI